MVREHPLRFEKANKRSIYPVLARRAPCTDQHLGICEVDTDPELFKDAARSGISTEATENYRLHADANQVGIDRFESEQSTRSKFEAQLADWAKDNLQLCFATQNASETERIKDLLADNPLTAKLTPRFLEGGLSAGFIYRQGRAGDPPVGSFMYGPKSSQKRCPSGSGFVLITESEYFGTRRRKVHSRTERARPSISQVDRMLDFTELADGDPLVHLQHGICLFRGLTKLTIQGGTKEVISVEFADDMTIHVPLHESHLLTRYLGLTKRLPKLGKIGGAAWDKTRSAAEVATLDYAAELLNLHAQRENAGGYAFPPDHLWQKTFEDAFPHQETADQLSAIVAAKQDMEKPLPMDRLICGDVGFKPKSPSSGSQSRAGRQTGGHPRADHRAVSAALQHLSRRMAQFPIIIDMVSRSLRANKELIPICRRPPTSWSARIACLARTCIFRSSVYWSSTRNNALVSDRKKPSSACAPTSIS